MDSESAFCFCVLIACIMFAGDPDLMDALIHHLMECK